MSSLRMSIKRRTSRKGCVCVRALVFECVLTWTVCNLLVGLLLTATSTQVEDTFISLQRKISFTKQKNKQRISCEEHRQWN